MIALPMPAAGWSEAAARSRSPGRFKAALHALWRRVLPGTDHGQKRPPSSDDDAADETAAVLIALACAVHY